MSFSIGLLPLLFSIVLPSTASAGGAAQAPCAALEVSQALAGPLGRAPRRQGQPLLHQKVSTALPAAQEAYDFGISHLALFEWLPAARFFCQALRLDSDLAMAYRGLGMALWELEESAASSSSLAAAQAAAARRAVSRREAAWISLAPGQLRLLWTRGAERQADLADFRARLAGRLPEASRDAHDHVLVGRTAGRERAVQHYRQALAEDPRHVGALHYLVHSLEGQGRPEEALSPALRLARQAPSSPHARHMVGHVLAYLGRWRAALEAFSEADLLHREHLPKDGLSPQIVWHFRHNLKALALTGWRLEDPRAEGWLRELFELGGRGWRGGLSCAPWLEYLLRHGRHGAASKAARGCAERPGLVARIVSRGALAEAALRQGDAVAAEAALAAALDDLDALRSLHPPGSRLDFLPEHLKSYLRTPRLYLRLQGRSRALVERSLREVAASARKAAGFDEWLEGHLRLERLQHLLAHPGQASGMVGGRR